MAHIMVVDDDRGIVSLIKTLLNKAGHRVTTSGSGQDALKKLGMEPDAPSAELPDLLLLDIMMPEVDGYKVGTVIRERERTRGIPIVVVSALRDLSPIFNATVKVEGFLTKPFAPEDLLALVAKILAAKDARKD
ncbi:MAG: response regulator [Elusimicrobia bacterium]|nr:response regulator [Elusimicrobiota bacterium]